MKKLNYLNLALCLIGAMSPFSLMANDDPDLSEQRYEVNIVNPVPGEKIDHKGIVINPTPQSLTMDNNSQVEIAKGFALDKSYANLPVLKKDMANIGLQVNEAGLPLTISEVNTPGTVQGFYTLNVTPTGVAIKAADNQGVYYALLTLKQIVTSQAAADGTVPTISIEDYPNLPLRGLVEGFYGTPWSHETRLSLIKFLGDNKMNKYIYGPKDDPYHRTPYWRQPYPADEAAKIRDLVEASNTNHVDFVWAIHPGGDIRWNKEDYDSMLAKFNMMYDLGVRDFAVFFDDIEGIGTNSEKQAQLLNNLIVDFAKPKGDVGNFIVCPTDYSQLWANPDMEKGQLAIYGNTLDKNTEVFWTGAVVCSDLTPETLRFVDKRIKRPALYWWNYPVTDYVRNIVMQGPVYGLNTTLGPDQLSGIVSNPMEHGEASKLALYGVADYAWNTHDYNPIDNWERSLVDVAPDVAEAYRTFAIHNCDTETGYRRDESWETDTFSFNNYTPEQFDALYLEFDKIRKAPNIIRSGSNKALATELEPWLVEFGKLGERGIRTLEMIKIYESGDESKFLEACKANSMTAEDRARYNEHKVATYKLQPFYETVMADIIADYQSRNY